MMEEELREITKKLQKWCEKYKKDYVSMCVVNGNASANVDTLDKDYRKLHIFIRREENQ